MITQRMTMDNNELTKNKHGKLVYSFCVSDNILDIEVTNIVYLIYLIDSRTGEPFRIDLDNFKSVVESNPLIYHVDNKFTIGRTESYENESNNVRGAFESLEKGAGQYDDNNEGIFTNYTLCNRNCRGKFFIFSSGIIVTAGFV